MRSVELFFGWNNEQCPMKVIYNKLVRVIEVTLD